ncbi:MAG: hypothetical protein LAT51_00480 [Flavobacteriaceae bacterium]|nr:hypothetical protein [Flavobacteriaceae bacterium]
MKRIQNYAVLVIMLLLLGSCSVETESHFVETPTLKLNAVGPMFEGSNTATASWEFDVNKLLAEEFSSEDFKDARIHEIKISIPENEDFPKINKLVMEMKSKYTSMNRIGLLEKNIKHNTSYNLKVADKQEEVLKALNDEKITFVGDFDLLEEEFYEDISFDLQVVIEVMVKK